MHLSISQCFDKLYIKLVMYTACYHMSDVDHGPLVKSFSVHRYLIVAGDIDRAAGLYIAIFFR